jgi:hypothetical protein
MWAMSFNPQQTDAQRAIADSMAAVERMGTRKVSSGYSDKSDAELVAAGSAAVAARAADSVGGAPALDDLRSWARSNLSRQELAGVEAGLSNPATAVSAALGLASRRDGAAAEERQIAGEAAKAAGGFATRAELHQAAAKASDARANGRPDLALEHRIQTTNTDLLS